MCGAQAARGYVSLAQPSSTTGRCRLWRQRSFRLIPIFPGLTHRRAPRSSWGPVMRSEPPPRPPAVRPGIEPAEEISCWQGVKRTLQALLPQRDTVRGQVF